MSVDSEIRPTDDSWIVAVHSSEHGVHPSGSGLVIDRQRILTCAHVARRIQDSGCEIWVAFPKSKNGPVSRLQVAREQVVFADTGAEVQDLAVLHLAEPVPRGVDPVPLRDPASASLLAGRWWAFGFPQGDPAGNSTQGTIGEALASGLLRIDRKSRYGIESGFSGAGVWSPEYRAAVAVITEAEDRRGDGRAIPLHHLEACFPGEQIAGLTGGWSAVEAGDVALSAWGWYLTGDPEAEQHWSPRARGVTIGSEHGYRFQGRTAALQVIKDWLDRDRDRDHRRMLVVTGAPGAGKSAVLGRIVTTADADAVKELPASDAAVRANVGSVACAVHAKGKTALEVATEIARAASAELPKDVDAFPRVLHAALTRQGRRFNVIIDALDEAVSLSEARDIIRKVMLPMTETFSDVDARVVAGSRRAGSSGDLLGRYRESSRLVDLDDPEFYAQEDLAAYALATLQLAGDKRSESEQDGEKPNPYADARVAGPVAARIAELSAGNFLVAGLTARTRGIADDMPKAPEQLSFSPRIGDAMDDYLKLVPETAGIDGGKLLTALAFAESPGLPVSLWCEAIQALGYGNVTEVQLVEFTQTRAASFLIESYGQDGSDAAFRLFHQALNDALLDTDDPGLVRKVKERALTRTFMTTGRDSGWEYAPKYLLRSLPAHASRAGLVDDLLADDAYLLHADLRRVLQVTNRAVSPTAHDRARLLGLTPGAVITSAPAERSALFSVTEALNGLGEAYQKDMRPAPYRAQWAAARPRHEALTLDTHQDTVLALCALEADGRTLLAIGGDSSTVQLRDSADGTQVHTLDTHREIVLALCAVEADGRTLLAIGGDSRMVQLWNPADGTQVRTLGAPRHGWTRALCTVKTDERTLLAAGGVGGKIQLWDPADGTEIRTLDTRQETVHAMCAVDAGGRILLAVADGSKGSGRVGLWDPADGTRVRALDTPRTGWTEALCTVKTGEKTLLAAAGVGGTIRLWDPADGTVILTLHVDVYQGSPHAVCGVEAGGRTLLAAGGVGGKIQLWDLADGTEIRTLDPHHGWTRALCTVNTQGRTQLAIGGKSGTVQLWDLLGATPSDREVASHKDDLYAVCGVEAGERSLLAAGGPGGKIQLWDLADGTEIRTLDLHYEWTRALCTVKTGGRTLLAAGGGGGKIHLWDLADGTEIRGPGTHPGSTRALCTVKSQGRTLLAIGDTYTVQLWSPADGTRVRTLDTHPGEVYAACAVEAGGQTLLAVGGRSGTVHAVQLWNPADGTQVRTLDTRHEWTEALCTVKSQGRTLLAAGCTRGKIRLWDLADGTEPRTLDTVHDTVYAMCTVEAGGRTLLAAGGDGEVVQLWDPADGTCVLTVPIHHTVRAAASMANSLMVGTSVGVVVIKFENDLLADISGS
jgi:WD40 repeat protein